MKSILSMGTDCLELNALFIQPTRWCALNCSGCYVKEHEGGEDSYHIRWGEWANLFTEIFEGKSIYTNQLTISMDDIPADRHMEMTGIFAGAIYGKSLSKTNTELHMTFHTLDTFSKYHGAMMKKYHIDSKKHIDMISFSHIKPDHLRFIRIFPRWTEKCPMINYNHLPPKNVSSENINKHVDSIEEIGQAVDHIYMLVTKSPMGKERNKFSQVADSERLRSDIAYINTIRERVSPDVRKKITVDGCVQDTRESLKTGFGCSSNVSRFQVWPDGSVTGCPYAFSGGPKIAHNAKDILENIRAARDRYDFRSICTLPSDYTYSPRRSKDQGTQIQNKRQVLPIIN